MKSSKSWSPVHGDGVMEQFQATTGSRNLDLDRYRRKYGNIHRMDRILKAENDSPDKYKIAKQADTLMLYYLLAPGQVSHILSIMGYDTGDPTDFMEKNYDYYLPKTTHGSTLSYITFSGILKYLPTS